MSEEQRPRPYNSNNVPPPIPPNFPFGFPPGTLPPPPQMMMGPGGPQFMPPPPHFPPGGPFPMMPPFPSHHPHMAFPFSPAAPINLPPAASSGLLVSAAAPVEVGQPNCTLYLQNLPEKPNPRRNLVPYLQEMFSKFGKLRGKPVIKDKLAHHGQAWIVFREQSAATMALKALQGTRVWGKSVVIRYARYKSECVIKAEGWNEEARAEEKNRRDQDRLERAKNPRITRRQLLNQMMLSGSSGIPSGLASGGYSNSLASSIVAVGTDVLLPNKILFIQSIPLANPSPSGPPVVRLLTDLFRRYPGFQDLRSIPNRPDVAFVEYENEAQAGAARQILDKHELLPGNHIRVSFARK